MLSNKCNTCIVKRLHVPDAGKYDEILTRKAHTYNNLSIIHRKHVLYPPRRNKTLSIGCKVYISICSM